MSDPLSAADLPEFPRAADVFTDRVPHAQAFADSVRRHAADLATGALGPASLPVFVSLGLGRELRHEVRTADGVHGWSAWGPA